ncbi:MAG: LytR/AlgR family response regulator transcription factor [Burkholderiales bacterium]|jgi:DNA-binding LytR/AlgR family response regulator|nr:LytTR family DNA-binding domain-containing protein [Nitrosomonadaceae bacterium]
MRERPTAVIAEDEALLRNDLLGALREAWPELQIVGEAEDGATAIEEIIAKRPDIVFLDIRMPGLSGLDVASIVREQQPDVRIVFVTAYDQYAVEAFAARAVDYLLKPVDRVRLAETVARLKASPSSNGAAANAESALRDMASRLSPPAEPLTWITASAGKETRLIMVDDIAFFQADNKYTVVMTAEGEALIRKPIKELLEALDPQQWKQVHRSTIVNLRAIKSIARDESGKGLVKFRSTAATVSVSQPFMYLFRNM